MYLRAFAFSVALVASACHSAEPKGEQRAEELVRAAQAHLEVPALDRGVEQALGASRRDLRGIRFDSPTDRRFATYFLAPDGTLKEFVLNQPDAETYTPIEGRVSFIEQMMEIAAPDSSPGARMGSEAVG